MIRVVCGQCFIAAQELLTEIPGSKRLFELSESISEIKSVCACGTKASVNARLNSKGEVMTEGEQVVIGGNEAYKAMCYQCYDRAVQKATKKSQ